VHVCITTPYKFHASSNKPFQTKCVHIIVCRTEGFMQYKTLLSYNRSHTLSDTEWH